MKWHSSAVPNNDTYDVGGEVHRASSIAIGLPTHLPDASSVPEISPLLPHHKPAPACTTTATKSRVHSHVTHGAITVPTHSPHVHTRMSDVNVNRKRSVKFHAASLTSSHATSDIIRVHLIPCLSTARINLSPLPHPSAAHMIITSGIFVGASLREGLAPARAALVVVMTAASQPSAAWGGERGGWRGSRIQRQHHPRHPLGSSLPEPAVPVRSTTSATPVPAALLVPSPRIGLLDTSPNVTFNGTVDFPGACVTFMAFDSIKNVQKEVRVESLFTDAEIEATLTSRNSDLPPVHHPLIPLPAPSPISPIRATATAAGVAVTTFAVCMGGVGLLGDGASPESPPPIGCVDQLASLSGNNATTLQISLQQLRATASSLGENRLGGRVPSVKSSTERVALHSVGAAASPAGVDLVPVGSMVPTTLVAVMAAQLVGEETVCHSHGVIRRMQASTCAVGVGGAIVSA